jgi:riboflavin biosynthesis pyrimidine reductase
MCIVSRSLELDGAADSLHNSEIRPLVITCDAAPAAKVVEFAPTMDLMSAGSESVDLPRALSALRRRGVRVVLCEGGPTLNSELLDGGLVDELCLTYAPFLGGDDLGLFQRGPAAMHQLNVVHAHLVEGSVFVRALVDSVRL